jgi:hypothetical protein
MTTSRLLAALGLALVCALVSARADAQADEYDRAVRVALGELAGGEVQAGRDRLAGLVEQSPQRTAAHCHLAEAHRMAGELDAAVESYRACARLARAAAKATHEARGLMGVAQTLARMEGRLEDAKAAFDALLIFAEAHEGVIDPALVRGRVQAALAMIEADVAAAAVKARREERVAELAAQAAEDEEEEDEAGGDDAAAER